MSFECYILVLENIGFFKNLKIQKTIEFYSFVKGYSTYSSIKKLSWFRKFKGSVCFSSCIFSEINKLRVVNFIINKCLIVVYFPN